MTNQSKNDNINANTNNERKSSANTNIIDKTSTDNLKESHDIKKDTLSVAMVSSSVHPLLQIFITKNDKPKDYWIWPETIQFSSSW